MKLSEVQLRDKVATVGPGEAALRLRSEPGPSPQVGWALDYEGGIVTAVKGDVEMLIPVSNVAYMRRAVGAETKRPVKAA